LMAAVERGADRNEVHEIIRKHSQAAAQQVKAEGQANDLLERLAGEKVFEDIDLNAVLDPSSFVGRAPEQVDAFIEQVVEPIRKRYAAQLGYQSELKV
jgi:adenylosuccinate lyase